MRYFVTYLVYIAVLARAAGWSQDSFAIPTPVWIMLGLFGLLLFSERPISRNSAWYPRFYILVQSVLVIAMLYISPRLDILAMLFLPLSFQVVTFFPGRVGFAWIGTFSLAMLGLFFVGAEVEAGISMILTSSGANLLMGSFARLMRRTGERQQENQRLFTDLQAAYRRLKDSAAQAEALAAAEERHRLVRELHDSLTQTLFSMNLAVQAAQLSAQEGSKAVDEQLARLQTLSRSAASEVQALTGQAPLSPLAQEGLAAALQRLAEERLAQDGLQVQLEISGERSFPETVQANLYRIVQEALNNITRHAGVRQAVVRLRLESQHASLEVEDEGCGFDPGGAVHQGAAQHGGFGLNGMAERAAEIGWRLAVHSNPEQGTCIRAEEKAE